MTRAVGLNKLRLLWLVLLGLALLARAMVPTGWMPVFDADGVRLTLCSGWSDPDGVPVATPHHPGSGEHHEGHAVDSVHEGHNGKHEPDKKSDHSAPCVFAASALSVALPHNPQVLAPAPVLGSFALAVILSCVGNRLAAPPPPSTGPPSSS